MALQKCVRFHDVIEIIHIFHCGDIGANMAEDWTRLTIRLPTHTVEQLRSELSHFNTDAARFLFLAQFYLDYKELGGQPVKIACGDWCNDGCEERDDYGETPGEGGE